MRTARKNAKAGIAALAGMMMLAACEPPPPATTSSAVPGPTLVGVSQAVKYFGDVCVDNAPGFANAPAALAAPTFAQNPATTTYFHRQLNMSFKLIRERGGLTCSMVFVSGADAEDLGLALAFRSSRQGQIGADPETGIVAADGPGGTAMAFFPLDNSNYYRAVLGKPN